IGVTTRLPIRRRKMTWTVNVTLESGVAGAVSHMRLRLATASEYLGDLRRPSCFGRRWSHLAPSPRPPPRGYGPMAQYRTQTRRLRNAPATGLMLGGPLWFGLYIRIGLRASMCLRRVRASPARAPPKSASDAGSGTGSVT